MCCIFATTSSVLINKDVRQWAGVGTWVLPWGNVLSDGAPKGPFFAQCSSLGNIEARQKTEMDGDLNEQALIAIFLAGVLNATKHCLRGGEMKTSVIILSCMVVGGILGFTATQSDIDFITSNWIYGSIVGSFLLSGWAMNYQRGVLMKEINELKDRIIELELARKQQ